MIGSRVLDLILKFSDIKFIIVISFVKDYGFDEIFMKLDDCGGLDVLFSCCGFDDLK